MEASGKAEGKVAPDLHTGRVVGGFQKPFTRIP